MTRLPASTAATPGACPARRGGAWLAACRLVAGLATWLLGGALPGAAQVLLLPPVAADSGRVVRALGADTTRAARADSVRRVSGRRQVAPPARAGVSLVGLSSLRRRWVQLDGQGRGRLADSVTVVPGTVAVVGGAGAGFVYEAATGRLTLEKAASRASAGGAVPDSVEVAYRVLPVNLGRPVFRRNRRLLDSLAFRDLFFTETYAPPREEILKTPGLQKSGNLARGISFGNAQNVFVNSALNLQLEGKLANKLNLTASITDQSVPFQPDGNTQQLQQFDRIFITLENPALWRLTGGDVVLRHKPTNFLRFYKNVQGGALEVASGTQAGRPGTTVLAAGIAKGKFASQQVAPLDNVQGPYRLRGPNGERFIIVLAGSERVYLDGVLLQRGFDLDYVVDYNQAEVTFSPRHLITRNARIRIEFEYSDQNYARSIVNTSHYQSWGRWTAALNLYREADNPDNAPNLDLRERERTALQEAGDSLDRAVVPGADSATYQRGTVQYRRSDSLEIGETVYRYTADSSQQLYNVRFADVGQGNGDYVQATTGAVNGRVFRYVGRRLGRYLPLRVLPAPNLRQLATAGLSYQVDAQTTLSAEVAASQLDRNRFSTRDDGDNDGVGLRLGYAVQDKPVRLLGAWKLRSALNYEYTDRRFSPIDRYRDVEFDRDWSTTTRTGLVGPGASDNLLNFSVGAVKDDANQLTYRVARRYRPGEVAGLQHWLTAARLVGNVGMHGTLFLLRSDGPATRSRWQRGEVGADWVKPGARLVPGYAYRFDQNRVLAGTGRDSVIASANYFDEHAVYVRSGGAGAQVDSARFRYRLDYTWRRTFVPLEGAIRRRDYAQTWQGTLGARLGEKHDLNLLATYRTVRARAGLGGATDSTRESAVLAKVDHSVSLLRDHVRAETSYAVATGREPRRLYQFQETTPGQGTHYLPPGADPSDLSSYVEAQTADPSQRRYIKVFLASDEYVVAYTNRVTWRLTTAAPRTWRTRKGWQGVVAKLSNLSFVSLDRRTTDPRLAQRLNPLSGQTQDESLLALNKVLRSTLFFNRAAPAYGAEVTVQQTQQKTLLTAGSDTRSLASQNLVLRRTLTAVFVARLELTRAVRGSASTALVARNFQVLAQEVAPELAWQPNAGYRLTGTYRYTRKRDTAPVALDLLTPPDPTRGRFHELGLETRISKASKRTLTGTLRFTKIEFGGATGAENTPVGYEILNALRPGNNLTWQATAEQRLANGLNLSVAYDGRKPDGIPAIHTGRMQVSVLF